MRQTHGRSRSLRLREIAPQAQLFGENLACTGCTNDLSSVQPGHLFACVAKADEDTHESAAAAVEQGAAAVLTERILPVDVPQLLVEDSREAYGQACHAFADFPSRQLNVVGVTGSYGKTTTSLLIASVLNSSRQGVAALTSLAYCDSVNAVPVDEATPDASELAKCLASAADKGCAHGVVELSSVGLAQRRAAGLELAVAVLTNLRREHLDQHGSAAAYRAIKERIFKLLRPEGVAILNADDAGCRTVLSKLDRPALTFGLHSEADITATVLERSADGQTFFLEAGNETVPVRTRMLGDHHVYNCLAAAAVGLVSGLPLTTIARGLESVESIPGRMERLDCGQDFDFFVDDARSHDALAMCLKTARQVTAGRVICVTTPGTNVRERPLLGRVLEKMASVSVITGPGGKVEKLLPAAHDVLDGFQRPGKAHVIPSRDKAIAWAIREAAAGDTVVVCGAGHQPWRNGRRLTDDASLAKHDLYELVAETNRAKPLVFAFSG